jgi:hypothetical protein
MSHWRNPLRGRTSVPVNAKLLSWADIESALRQTGQVPVSETVQCFVVADDGIWLVLERKR